MVIFHLDAARSRSLSQAQIVEKKNIKIGHRDANVP